MSDPKFTFGEDGKMSEWIAVKKDDIKLSDDGTEIEINYSWDNNGNKYITVKTEDILNLIGKSRWRDVREELPKDPEWVLVYADRAMNCVVYTGGRFKDLTNVIDIEKITHWQPLPEGPV